MSRALLLVLVLLAGCGSEALSVDEEAAEAQNLPSAFENPAPAVVGLELSPISRCGPNVLTVTGAGFVESSVVLIDGAEVSTTLVSEQTLTVPRAALLQRGNRDVRVKNPAPGGGESAPVFLFVE